MMNQEIYRTILIGNIGPVYMVCVRTTLHHQYLVEGRRESGLGTWQHSLSPTELPASGTGALWTPPPPSLSSFPVLLARALASFLIWSTAVGCHPPSVSTGKVMKAMPSLAQAWWAFLHFSSNAIGQGVARLLH